LVRCNYLGTPVVRVINGRDHGTHVHRRSVITAQGLLFFRSCNLPNLSETDRIWPHIDRIY